MYNLDRAALDRHITGNYGEDSVPDEVCTICPTCGSDNTEWADDGNLDCLNCGVFFDPYHPYVQEDQRRILAGKEPIHDVR